MFDMYFEKATILYKDIIFEWLKKPHIQEFWDNSPEYKQDIVIFMEGREAPSPYYNGTFDYWIGFLHNDPFCLIMTSEVLPTPDLPPVWLEHISQTGKTFSLDFMIGNKKFLGQGFGGPTLENFMRYFQKNIEPKTDIFIIDPAANNPKAAHVYEKAGFKKIVHFMRNNTEYVLMIKNASKNLDD
ncbi:MAG: GNAT family N-acetyltransferase [Candidatus Babeliaceae bacterium]|jgi:RimJ/RimL family protein N-acetyltransferase